MAGPTDRPMWNTPVKRENICAREPSEVQSDMYAVVALWRVDQPPSSPSMNGARIRSLWPWEAKSVCGVDTKMNVKSLNGI